MTSFFVILAEEKGLVKGKYYGLWREFSEPQHIVDFILKSLIFPAFAAVKGLGVRLWSTWISFELTSSLTITYDSTTEPGRGNQSSLAGQGWPMVRRHITDGRKDRKERMGYEEKNDLGTLPYGSGTAVV